MGHPTERAMRASRLLRRRTTDAEKELWWHLRRKLPMEDTHFRRQVPIGPYVVDFCCQKRRLVVELDGGQHANPSQAALDIARDAFLNAAGYHVLRFWNAMVFQEIDSVVETIWAAMALAPPPPSPPLKGEGRVPRPASKRQVGNSLSNNPERGS